MLDKLNKLPKGVVYVVVIVVLMFVGLAAANAQEVQCAPRDQFVKMAEQYGEQRVRVVQESNGLSFLEFWQGNDPDRDKNGWSIFRTFVHNNVVVLCPLAAGYGVLVESKYGQES